VVDVVHDIVKRYKVDAIHMDDYFYPYRIPGKDFPDYRTFQNADTKLSLAEWRRSNVDSTIVALYRTIKKVNPKCQFGISPFGVWRNNDVDSTGSATRAGISNYDDLYADILLWLKNGWIDYVAPQLYWEIEHPKAPFLTLLDWWSNHTYGKIATSELAFIKPAAMKPGKIPCNLEDRLMPFAIHRMCREWLFTAVLFWNAIQTDGLIASD
jgi:uncharacterized lipoprotein YddW (UPF0748 family)